MQNQADYKTNQADAKRQQGWLVQRAPRIFAGESLAGVLEGSKVDSHNLRSITGESVRSVASENGVTFVSDNSAQLLGVDLALAGNSSARSWGNPDVDFAASESQTQSPASLNRLDVLKANEFSNEWVHNFDGVIADLELWANEGHPSQCAGDKCTKNGRSNWSALVNDAAGNEWNLEGKHDTSVSDVALWSELNDFWHCSILAVPTNLQVKGK